MLAAFVVVGCAPSIDDADNGPRDCIPGQTQTCLCPGGSEGVQSCNPDGASFSPCDCTSGGDTASSTSTSGGDCVPAEETCNGADDDCDGDIDETGATGCTDYFLDQDGDGFGVEGDTACECEPGWTHSATVAGDCDDSIPAVNPDASLDDCNVGLPLDDDCDGSIDEDSGVVCENAAAAGGPEIPEEPLWYPLAQKSWAESTYPGHPGHAVDIACPRGTPVYAAKDGYVLFTQNACQDNDKPLNGTWSAHWACGGGYGNNIIVQHVDGSITRYAHLKQAGVMVSEQEFVCAGQQIGVSGASGKVTSKSGGKGDHLHFEYKNPKKKEIYPPNAFEDVSTYRGGNMFFDACADIDALHSKGIVSKSCTDMQSSNQCTVNRATLAKMLGDSVDVEKTSKFGQCTAVCNDMNEADWFYDWMVAMTLISHGDATTPYNAAPECKPGALPLRVEALKATMEALAIPTNGVNQQTPDLELAPQPLRPYVNGAVLAGMFGQTEYVSPLRPLTYGFAARTLVDALAISAQDPISDADLLAVCPGAPPPQCAGAQECDDANPCTADACQSGMCQHSPAANGTGCGANKTCQNGQCVGPIAMCNNGVKEAGEVCDTSDFGGATCLTTGHDGGSLSCNASCSAISQVGCCDDTCTGTTQCLDANTKQTCGNYDADPCKEWGSNQSCPYGCANGDCLMPMCNNGIKEGGEMCDGAQLGNATCMTQGYSGGTLTCTSSCTFDTSGCCNNECSGGQKQCTGTSTFATCGNYDGDACMDWSSSQSCQNGQSCSGGSCACLAGNTGQFQVMNYVCPSFGPVGCSGDGTTKLKGCGEMISPTVFRMRIRKADDTTFTQAATLRLYVGSGPTCPNPPNVEKITKQLQVGVNEQTIDLTVNPYGDTWNLNEQKLFWVGKDESGFESFRATNTVTVKRACIP